MFLLDIRVGDAWSSARSPSAGQTLGNDARVAREFLERRGQARWQEQDSARTQETASAGRLPRVPVCAGAREKGRFGHRVFSHFWWPIVLGWS